MGRELRRRARIGQAIAIGLARVRANVLVTAR
jgi:hypothetical protein